MHRFSLTLRAASLSAVTVKEDPCSVMSRGHSRLNYQRKLTRITFFTKGSVRNDKDDVSVRESVLEQYDGHGDIRCDSDDVSAWNKYAFHARLAGVATVCANKRVRLAPEKKR